nr:unnamed protein product [Callosobruchus analis]
MPARANCKCCNQACDNHLLVTCSLQNEIKDLKTENARNTKLGFDFEDVVAEALEEWDLLNGAKVIIVGDFNIPKFISGDEMDGKTKTVNNFMSYFNLSQYNNVLNVSSRLLDLVISNFMCMVEKDCIPLIQIDDHHPALCIKVMDILYRERSFDTNSHAKVYNFKKVDFIRLYDALTDTDWSFLESFKDVNLAVDEFYKRIYEVLDSHVPQYKNYRRKFPQWYDATIIRNIKEKAKIRRKWKQANDTRFKYAFEDLRSIIKSQIKDAYRNHLRAVERSVKQDPASFWSFIHQKKQDITYSR